jgi:uncharacterized protein (TIGR02145 family)
MKKLIRISGVIVISILIHSCKKEADNSIKDIDGNSYGTQKIGTQVWLKENLKTTRYQNGDLIGTTSPATLDIRNETAPAYQWSYDDNAKEGTAYGRLYSWSVVTDSRNVCPAGWHVPSYTEWKVLTDYLTNNSYGYEGSGNDIAKSIAAQSGWFSVPTAGSVGNDQTNNNGSGFTALPAGYRNADGIFQGAGLVGYWWSTTETSTTDASSRYVRFGGKSVNIDNKSKPFGFSVRCLKDN